MSAEDKKKWGIGALCVVIVALAVFAIIREMPPPMPITGPGMARGYPGMGRGGPGGGGGRGGPGGGAQLPGTGGQIMTISANSITVQPRGGAAKTFTLTAATKITLDRNPATAADLKAGQRGRVVSTDGKTATEVHIRTRPFGGPGGPPGRGGTGGYPGGGGFGGYPGGLGGPAPGRPSGPSPG